MRTIFAITLVLSSSVGAVSAPPKKFSSAVVSKDTKDHRVDIEIDIRGARHLVLEVTDGGNGSGYDWADWIEPRLVGKKGELALTELKWSRLTGRARVNENQGGGPLRVGGKPVRFGIGTHAPSVIVYDLPPGYRVFRARGGLDNGGTDQKGSHSSVVFQVRTTIPSVVSFLAEGFRAEQLYDAKLPEVGSWVVLSVDGKGRLISADRQGAMYRIVVPEIGDEGGSTKVERLDVHVGGANGVLEAFGSLYVVGKGRESQRGKDGLFRLTDSDGDDQYEKIEFLIPLRVGGDHHAHAVLRHPDGERLTILCGNSTDLPPGITTRHIRNQKEDHLLPRGTYYGHNTGRKAPGGFVLICNPDGTDRRLHGAGFRNPYDFAYNREGELFTFDADMEYDVGGPWYRPTRVNHTVSGADFGWRWGAGKWPEYYPDSVGSVVDIGRGSPTGVVFGHGAKFPARYQEALFIADWTYGRMFAVHLRSKGATYEGTAELFVQGRGMPVSDVVIRPQDGAMYYVTGGRRQRTRLFRVTYVGEEPTAPVVPSKPTGTDAELRELRRGLEALHGKEDPGTVAAAWPYLSHADRAVRFAARTAIEHQPVATWAEKAIVEPDDVAAIEAAVALARFGGQELRQGLLERLEKLDFGRLALEQQLDVLRAWGLVFIRMGGADERATKRLVSTLSPLFPSGDRSLDRELCQVLLYLKAPGVVSRSVKQLLAADTQADEMFYAYHLRTVDQGWTLPDLEACFGWLNATEAASADYVAGGHFRNFLKTVRKDLTKRLDAAQRKALASVLQKKAPPPKRPTFDRKFVREWTLDDLRPALERVETGRAFIRGKKIHEALCSSCHLFNGKGGALGPDLGSVGGKMSSDALLVEILDPSRVISDQHASYVLALKDGSTLVGRDLGGDDDTIRVAVDPKRPDEVVEVKKSDIVLRERSPTSMMPKDLLNVLTVEEILDLMMYLLSGGKAGHTAFDK